MVMISQDVALALAGIIGSGVAVVHGILTQRLVVQPFQELAKTRLAAGTRRLVPGLLHFTTFNWFVGGLVLLVAAACSFDQEARLATGLLVGSSYLFGAVGNLWATRRLHPGWVPYSIALILIVYGVGKPSA